MLPVAHFVNPVGIGVAIPRLYNPHKDTWEISNEYVESYRDTDFIENDLIVGYYMKAPTGISIKFKVRSPKHKMTKHADTRMKERGAVCETKKRAELTELANTLDLKVSSGDSIDQICKAIKLELMYRELRERKKARHGKLKKGEKRKKWFYLHFEPQDF